ncbi:hypothetical protein A4H97_24935 [Niastella yeongjuensis]|uniref:RDD domain-containing protein n=1 Tax=Niastella yeongjuensis TaxID=354355 RepID=A0A1V9F2U0_9BACT|nr:RDD family protein [Niastella yeongjuensis]OQP52572.1 hypothetical protein A4H97_24935 [Niastella yeongjuensis]SEP34237.1 Uncharacterized membrane protein YckC, RDD family [Niastella yeongjuensis]
MDDILNDFEAPPPASVFKRWLASFIDYLVFAGLAAGILHYTGDHPILKVNKEYFVLLNDNIKIIVVVISWLLALPVYETLNRGRTLGKDIFMIKAIKQDGSKLSFGRSVVRHLFDFIDFLPVGGLVGLATANSNKNAQRVGDLVAKTIVVESSWDGK